MISKTPAQESKFRETLLSTDADRRMLTFQGCFLPLTPMPALLERIRILSYIPKFKNGEEKEATTRTVQ